jgi:hypothetical protein
MQVLRPGACGLHVMSTAVGVLFDLSRCCCLCTRVCMTAWCRDTQGVRLDPTFIPHTGCFEPIVCADVDYPCCVVTQRMHAVRACMHA